MFAGFDFKIDSQENLINFSDYVIQGKNHLDSSKADVERNLKEIVINGTESLDGSSIQGEWFPEINADIFISHSRDDADLANVRIQTAAISMIIRVASMPQSMLTQC